jgi:hypothetical protein
MTTTAKPEAAKAAAVQYETMISNFIGVNRVITLQGPDLANGEWVPPPPENFSQVTWQAQQLYKAVGELPEGVEGSVSVRIDGTPGTSFLTWTRNINTTKASFDGHDATPGTPYKGTWKEQKVTLTVDAQGSKFRALLSIGSDQG